MDTNTVTGYSICFKSYVRTYTFTVYGAQFKYQNKAILLDEDKLKYFITSLSKFSITVPLFVLNFGKGSLPVSLN